MRYQSSWLVTAALAAAAALALQAQAQTAPPPPGLNLGSLVYEPVEPCRIVDTRQSVDGNLVPGTPQTFLSYGIAAELADQGGGGVGCPHPRQNENLEPVAIAANVTAVASLITAPFGNIVAYPADGSKPSSSLVNFVGGQNIANSTVIALSETDATLAQFNLAANGNGVPGIVDVQGYFYPQNLKNVIKVSEAGGDFQSLQDAMAAIPATGDNAPTSTNRYLIMLGPGNYDLNGSVLKMRSYISVAGSGWGTTTIFSQRSGPVVEFDSVTNSSLTNLTVLNPGASEAPGRPGSTASIANAIAIKVHTTSLQASEPHIQNVQVISRGGSLSTIGVQVLGSGSPSVRVAPFLERLDVLTSDPRSSTATTGVELSPCSDAYVERVNVFATTGTALSVGACELPNTILWSQFSGTNGGDDVGVGGGGSIRLAHSHLVSGNTRGLGTSKCLNVTAADTVLNDDCSTR